MYQPMPPPPAPAPHPRPRRSVPALVPHVIWEAVLLVVVAAVTAILILQTPVPVERILWQVGFIGLIASGLALSLRTATPNLAVAGIAALSGGVYAELASRGAPETPVTGTALSPVLAAVIALGVVVALGAVLGLVTGLTSVPGWAVSLAGLAVTQAVVFGSLELSGTAMTSQLPAPLDSRISWFVIFVVVTLGGGALFAIPPVRQFLGASRLGGDRVRFDARKLVGALVGFVGSSLLAGLAGIAYVQEVRFFQPGSLSNYHLLVALAAVLVGGVSAFGGRGGIAGTALGVGLVIVPTIWITTELDPDLSRILIWTIVAVAILVGVGVSRALEAIAPTAPDPAPPAVPVPPVPPVAPSQPAMSTAPVEPVTEPLRGGAEPPGPAAEDRDR